MNINQHNYEEFFLLYADGELSAADRQAVEQFAQANPGLADELEMLLQIRLGDEPVLFEGKESLYRNEASEINLNNCEEQFLLYVDNELDAASREKVETFVLQHPALQESFTFLKQTRLEPEAIVFPGKASLYRKEEKEKPVFYLRWQKIAIAAALTGLAVLVWTMFPADKFPDRNTAGLEQKNNPAAQKNNDGAVKPNNSNTEALLKTNSENIASHQTGNITKQVIGKNNFRTINTVVENQHPNTLPAPNNTDVATAAVKREPIVTNPVETVEKDAYTQKLPAANVSLNNTEMVKVNHPTDDANNADQLAQQTVYKELDTEDENKSLYLGSLEINKDKLRGFFRKAGSLFRGKAKQEDERTGSATPLNTRSLK